MNAPNRNAQFSEAQIEGIHPIIISPRKFRMPVERWFIAALLLGAWGRMLFLLTE